MARCSLLVAAPLPSRPPAGRGGSSRAVAAAIAVYQLAFFAAVDRTGVAVGTVVALGSAPASPGVAGRLIDAGRSAGRWAARDRAGLRRRAAARARRRRDSVDPLGIMLALVSGSGYATYTVASKRLLPAGHAPEA